MTSIVLRERKDTCATLTLNRPERLNALSLELTAALDELDNEPSIRVVLLRG